MLLRNVTGTRVRQQHQADPAALSMRGIGQMAPPDHGCNAVLRSTSISTEINLKKHNSNGGG